MDFPIKKMDNFVRLSKINFTTLKILLFSNFLLFLFFYFKAIFKNLPNYFGVWINTIHHNKLYAPTCMHNQLLNLMMNFKLMKFFIFLYFMCTKNSNLNHFNSISKEANLRVLQIFIQRLCFLFQ